MLSVIPDPDRESSVFRFCLCLSSSTSLIEDPASLLLSSHLCPRHLMALSPSPPGEE